MTCQLCQSTNTQDLSGASVINLFCPDCKGHFYRNIDGSMLGWYNEKDWKEYVNSPVPIATIRWGAPEIIDNAIKEAMEKVETAPARSPGWFELSPGNIWRD